MSLGILALAHLSIGIKGIVLFGNEKQKHKYLVPAASGEMIFSYALTEPQTGSDARNIQTVATVSEDGSHFILNGSKTYITNANYAGGLTVFAQLVLFSLKCSLGGTNPDTWGLLLSKRPGMA